MSNRKGFETLAEKHFGGDENQAADWVRNLGLASYFWYTRPGYSISLLAPYRAIFPHLFIMRKNLIIGINWRSEQMRNRDGKGPII